MFKSILDLFKSHGELDKIEGQLQDMLALTKDMFLHATQCMMDGVCNQTDQDTLEQQDARVNALNKDIKAKVHAFLATCGPSDIRNAMVFMAMVQDIERVGDYTKNIADVLFQAKARNPEPCHPQKLRMRTHIMHQFDNIAKALRHNDEALARTIVEKSRRDQETCQDFIWSLVEGRTDLIDTSNPVACALLFRYFKRVFSHLVHAATAIYLPVDKMDRINEPET